MCKPTLKNANKHLSGTSLVELLVVIVIFLIGILAIAQIFPRGFKVLATTRAASISTTLANANLKQWNTDSLPEQIIAVYTANNGGTIVELADNRRTEDDLGPQGTAIVQNTNYAQYDLLDSNGASVGRWELASGSNNIRRVIGEGGTVPAPRAVGTSFGGLVTLQFAPIAYNASDLNKQPGTYGTPSLYVYGSDLQRLSGNPTPVQPGQQVLSYQYYLDSSDLTDPVLYIPAESADRDYKLVFTAFIKTGTGPGGQPLIDQRDFVAIPPITVTSGTPGTYAPAIHLKNLPGIMSGGETFNSLDVDSVRLSRMFHDVTTTGFTSNPYEYQVLDKSLGLILVNKAAYGKSELTASGQQTPIQVRADYDVYDWRVLKEDFRVPDAAPYEFRLQVGNLKHHNGIGPDGKPFLGIGYPNNVLIGDERGGTGTENRDVIVLDLASGGIYSKSGFTIDYSNGVLTFKDQDGNGANGLQVGIVLPGTNAPSTINAAGRSVRVFYMANGEWSSQLLKAATFYTLTQSATPSPGQYYVPPRSGPSTTNGDVTIRFPRADAGKMVTLDEAWYVGSDNLSHVVRCQSFAVHADTGGGNPYVNLRDAASDATGADFSNGYAVKGVKGASLAVRVLYNLDFAHFGNDGAANIDQLNTWGHGWHRTATQGAVDRGLFR